MLVAERRLRAQCRHHGGRYTHLRRHERHLDHRAAASSVVHRHHGYAQRVVFVRRQWLHDHDRLGRFVVRHAARRVSAALQRLLAARVRRQQRRRLHVAAGASGLLRLARHVVLLCAHGVRTASRCLSAHHHREHDAAVPATKLALRRGNAARRRHVVLGRHVVWRRDAAGRAAQLLPAIRGAVQLRAVRARRQQPARVGHDLSAWHRLLRYRHVDLHVRRRSVHVAAMLRLQRRRLDVQPWSGLDRQQPVRTPRPLVLRTDLGLLRPHRHVRARVLERRQLQRSLRAQLVPRRRATGAGLTSRRHERCLGLDLGALLRRQQLVLVRRQGHAALGLELLLVLRGAGGSLHARHAVRRGARQLGVLAAADAHRLGHRGLGVPVRAELRRHVVWLAGRHVPDSRRWRRAVGRL